MSHPILVCDTQGSEGYQDSISHLESGKIFAVVEYYEPRFPNANTSFICCHIAGGLEYIGKCPLSSISAM
jgi:hypothetical protein